MKNLLTSNKFKMSFSGDRFKDKHFEDYVTNIVTPSITLGTVIQGTPIRQLERPGDSIIFSDFTLDFLIDENMENYELIYNWLNELRNFDKMKFDNSLLVDISIIYLTNKNNTNKGYKLGDAFPYSISSFPMDITNADPEGTPVSVDFKYNYLEFLSQV